MPEEPILLHERIGQTALLTLNRPRRRNAISRALLKQLLTEVAAIDQDPSVAAIILTGTDPAFCSGVDLGELLKVPGAGREVGPRSEPMFTCRTPVIGAINGAAYTGGFELALNCHVLIASERAHFADTHAQFGFTPGWGLTTLLTEAVGRARARRLALSGEAIDAQRAYDWGLVSEVTAHEHLLPRALELAERIAGQNRDAVRAINGLFHDQARLADHQAWRLEQQAWIDPDTRN